MAHYLLTGAAGFIGTSFVNYWHDSNPQDRIVVLDALTYAGNKNNLVDLLAQDWFEFVHGSICDQELVESLLHKHEMDTLVHFAAESHVDRSITGPDAFIDTNIVGTHSLLKAAKKYWIDENAQPEHLFHHVSTDEVYGTLGADDPAFSETTAYAPNSPYAASKWAVVGMTKTLAMELGKYKIRVNAICPGTIKGDRMKRVIRDKAKFTKISAKKIESDFVSMASMKSWINEEDIGNMCAHLISDSANKISGQVIAVDGNAERMD